MLDSVINAKKKYYSQTLLEEQKYGQEKIKVGKRIDNGLEKSLSDDSDNEVDNDYDDESNK